MILSCQRDPYKVLWTVALLLCFAEILSAQNRLGLHFTQEELNIRRQRAQNGPYKTRGDVCTNSPGDWERIVGHANAFLSNPSGERWKGQTNASIMTPDGGPKNLLVVMTHHAKYVNESTIEGFATAISDLQKT